MIVIGHNSHSLLYLKHADSYMLPGTQADPFHLDPTIKESESPRAHAHLISHFPVLGVPAEGP